MSLNILGRYSNRSLTNAGPERIYINRRPISAFSKSKEYDEYVQFIIMQSGDGKVSWRGLVCWLDVQEQMMHLQH